MVTRDVGAGLLRVQRVIARVELEPGAEEQARHHERYQRLADHPLSSDHLRLHVSLSAELSDGRRLHTGRPDFGVAGPRRGLGAIWHRYHGPWWRWMLIRAIPGRTYRVGRPDIEDAINQMLGRDPELHRPPRLAWDNLIAALAKADVDLTQQALIDAPLTVDLGPEVRAEIDER